jgi:hypothetical protein
MNFLGIAALLIQVQLGSAGGIVTKPGGTEPLPGATVTLTPSISAQSSRTRSVASGDDGRFTFQDIEPGDYRLQVQSMRYGSASYGERKPNGPGAILTIAAGQQLTDLKVSMQPTGAIAGRILGRSGEPLAYATVQALKYSYREGKRFLTVAQATTTDDRGEYRLFWLNSAKYVVVAAPRSSLITITTTGPLRPGQTIQSGPLALAGITMPGQLPEALLEGVNLASRILEDGTVRDESWLPTYYPATTDRAQAVAIDLGSGATVTGIDITLGPSPVQKIRGRVVGFPAGSPVNVSLGSGIQGVLGRLMRASVSPGDGSFEFAGVVPGAYVLTAQDQAIADRPGVPPQPGLLSKPVSVLVGNGDVDGLLLGLERGIYLDVRLTIEGAGQGPLDRFYPIAATLRPDVETPEGGFAANLRTLNSQIGTGNAMPFTNVPPGDYQLQFSQLSVQGNGRPLYVKSMRLGNEDALGGFRLASDRASVLEVIFTAATGSVEGTAFDRAGDPAANATIVLVPANARKRISLYKTLVTGSDGRFQFDEVPPGDYKVFAWDDVENGAWENAEFIRPFEARGQSIRVSENSKEALTLTVIYNP